MIQDPLKKLYYIFSKLAEEGNWNSFCIFFMIAATQKLMEDNLNFHVNGKRPQFFRKWQTTSI
jgi:hypothetical protein